MSVEVVPEDVSHTLVLPTHNDLHPDGHEDDDDEDDTMKTTVIVDEATLEHIVQHGDDQQQQQQLQQLNLLHEEEESEEAGAEPEPEEAAFPRPGRSRVWNYCLKLTREASICNLCQTILNCRGSSTSSLTKHLKNKHQIDVNNLPPDQASEPVPLPFTVHPSSDPDPPDRDDPASGTHDDQPAGHSQQSWTWSYFDVLPEARARCKLCSKVLARRGGSTSSLITHLRTKHALENGAGGRQTRAVNEAAGSGVDFTGASSVWKHFDKISEDQTRCRLCDKVLKRATGSTSNMIRHLRRQHEIELTTPKAAASPADPNQTEAGSETEESDAALWEHFQALSDGQTQCRLCPKVLGHTGGSTAGLIKHLRMKHDIDKHGEPLPTNGRSTQKSVVWHHFDELSPSQAQCKQCDKIFKRTGGSTSTLLRHLRRKHKFDEFEVVPSDDDDESMGGGKRDPEENDEDLTDKPVKKESILPKACRTAQRSRAWDFFEDLPDDKAVCQLCHKILSRVGGCTSALLKHLRSQHPDYESYKPLQEVKTEELLLPVVQASDDHPLSYSVPAEHVEEEEEEDMKPLKSFVWDYFLPSHEGYATCRVCNKGMRIVNSSTTSLKRHLKARHNIEKGDDKSKVVFLVSERIEPEAEPEDIWSGVFEELEEDTIPESFEDEFRMTNNKRSWNGTQTSASKMRRTASPKTNQPLDSSGRSLVWDYCESLGSGLAKCTLCLRTLAIKGSSTSALIRHLTRIHDINLSRANSSSENNPGNLVPTNPVKGRPLKFSEMDQNESATELLAKLISVDGFPVNGVLKSAYINEACSANSLIMPTSTDDLVVMLIDHADELKAKAAQELMHMAKIDLRFSLTLDVWSTESGGVHLAVNCYSQGLSWSLGLIRDIQSHTSDSIREAVKKKVSRFGLEFERDIVACTTDSPFLEGVEEQICLARGIHEAIREVFYQPLSPEKQALEDKKKKTNSSFFGGASNWSTLELIPEITEIIVRAQTQVIEIFKAEPAIVTMQQRYQLDKVATFDPTNDWEELLEQVKALLDVQISLQDHLFLPESDWKQLIILGHHLGLIFAGLTSLNSKDIDLLSADKVINQLLGELEKTPSDYSELLRQLIQDKTTQRQRHDIVALLQYFNHPKQVLASNQVSRDTLQRDIGLFSRRLFPSSSEVKSKESSKAQMTRIEVIAEGMSHFETTECLSSDLKNLQRALNTISPTCRQSSQCSPNCKIASVFHPFDKGHFSLLEDALIFLKGFYDQRS